MRLLLAWAGSIPWNGLRCCLSRCCLLEQGNPLICDIADDEGINVTTTRPLSPLYNRGTSVVSPALPSLGPSLGSGLHEKGMHDVPCKLAFSARQLWRAGACRRQREGVLTYFLLMLSRPCVYGIYWICISSKSRPARKEQAGRIDIRATEQAGWDCVPGCEEKARDVT
ncbi:hypothetical protein B0T18DRAFT_90630 [Schizothecium vesticola]|uniref:Uncharacterized protein n=1 Tax=Schizothecium vesticola TaxID=314040 RepID=A0AA40F750_9PEZI|nr:hypothetical protein B0T18DRAFT_90630 [Schizothecium vesticola]